MHENTIGALNVQGYWDPLLTMMNHLVGEGFVHPVNRARLIADDELPRLLDALLP